MDIYEDFLPRRAGQYANCTLDTCPVSESLYGYLPSNPVNLIFVALFATSCLLHVIQGLKNRCWTFLFCFGIGTATEAIGYVGRLMMRKDPWSKGNIGIQLVCLTIAPAFLAGGIYLTLKHIIIIYGARFSRITPRWYTWIFVTCDILSILIQSAGAVIASSGSHISLGNDVMMLGLVSQVVTLSVFGAMATEVYFRIRKFRGEFNESTIALRNSERFKYFLIATIIAYACISVRCIYRITEMAGGWRNKIMESQVAFVILDGVMCVIAVFAMNFFHPGFLFKQSYATLKTEQIEPDMEMANAHGFENTK
ncbi:RTA1-domain-containing protein [Stipitochalara longipes BDJ]|nr:RTA1-domain-containing protein [Stipitochalara longipes BDJ]